LGGLVPGGSTFSAVLTTVFYFDFLILRGFSELSSSSYRLLDPYHQRYNCHARSDPTAPQASSQVAIPQSNQPCDAEQKNH